MEPVASRPRFPEDYGVPKESEGLLAWSSVAERLAGAKHYWLSTVTPGGAPHTRPIDGFWLDGRLYFGGGPGTGWRRNLAENPRACVNLEDGEQAVILHGTVAVVRSDRPLAVRLFEMSSVKYAESHGQSADDYEGQEVLVFEPDVAFAWRVFFEDATRWHFPAAS